LLIRKGEHGNFGYTTHTARRLSANPAQQRRKNYGPSLWQTILQARASKGGKALVAKYGREFFVHVASMRWKQWREQREGDEPEKVSNRVQATAMRPNAFK